MAALSYYSNWTTTFDHLNSELSVIFTQPQLELPSQLMNENPENHHFDPNDLFHFDEYYNSFNPFPVQQGLDECHYPKRQKPCFDYQETVFSNAALFHSPVSPMPQFPDFATGKPVYSYGIYDQSVKRQKINKGSVSTQSIAARQRRKRISEKTNELSKLIPGSQRMNTAEMFQAAYNYIKYLQAQVGILEFMGSYEKEKGTVFESEELNCLVESPLVQEKLYSNEKCLAPYNFVQDLNCDEKFKCQKLFV